MWLYGTHIADVQPLGVTENERPCSRTRSPPCSSAQGSTCPRTISPGLPIATSHRRACGSCCGYNFIDAAVFALRMMERFAFRAHAGTKRKHSES